MTLNDYEKETIIIYNNEEKIATIETYDKALIKILKRNSKGKNLNPLLQVLEVTKDYCKCKVPKGWIEVNIPIIVGGKKVSNDKKQNTKSK